MIGPRRQVARGVRDLDIQREPPLAQPMEDAGQAGDSRCSASAKVAGNRWANRARPSGSPSRARAARPHLVDHGRALHDEALAHPVERLQLQLLGRLQRDAAYARPTARFRDRRGIMEIVLVACTYGFTNCAGSRRTSWPASVKTRPEYCEPAHASVATTHRGAVAANRASCERFSFLRNTVAPAHPRR